MKRWVDGAALAAGAGYAVLAWLARAPGEPNPWAFLALAGAIQLLAVGVFVLLGRRAAALSGRRVLGYALVFRLIGVVGGPFLEDDHFRYLWDGYRFAEDGTPYGAPPEAWFGDPGVPGEYRMILDQVNNPDLPTVYGPTAQVLFLLARYLSPARITGLQILLVGFDLLLIALLLRLAPTRAVLLHAFSPLVVKEVAFAAHPDGFAVCLLFAAVVLSLRRRFSGASLILAFAVGAKVFALAAAPFVLCRAGWRHRAAFLATLTLLYLPFVLQGGTDLSTLLVMAREWQFNAPVFGVLAMWLPDGAARIVCGTLFLSVAALLFERFRRESATVFRGDLLFGALLVLAPVVNPWYLLFVLPFSVVHPTPWAWTASGSVLLSYLTGLNLNDLSLHPYGHPDWVLPVEYGLIGLAAVAGFARRRLRGRFGSRR